EADANVPAHPSDAAAFDAEARPFGLDDVEGLARRLKALAEASVVFAVALGYGDRRALRRGRLLAAPAWYRHRRRRSRLRSDARGSCGLCRSSATRTCARCGGLPRFTEAQLADLIDEFAACAVEDVVDLRSFHRTSPPYLNSSSR